jgi:hypothetical protein
MANEAPFREYCQFEAIETVYLEWDNSSVYKWVPMNLKFVVHMTCDDSRDSQQGVPSIIKT